MLSVRTVELSSLSVAGLALRRGLSSENNLISYGKEMQLRSIVFSAACLILILILSVSVFGAGAGADAPGPWPQFRGPNGLGVSPEPNLPAVWDKTGRNIKWKTKVPGVGNSSPVVSNGCVILTTAYDSLRARTLHRGITTAAGLLTLFFLGISLGGLVLRCRRAVRSGNKIREGLRSGWFNTVFAAITTGVFLFFALLTTIWREQSGAVLSKIGLALASMGLPDMEHLYSMDTGVHAAAWLTAGGIAILGLAVAVGRIKAHSVWRIIGAGTVLVLSKYLINHTPLDQWSEKIKWCEKLIFMLPAQIVALWHLVNYLDVAFKPPAQQDEGEAPPAASKIKAAADKLNRLEIRCIHKNLLSFGGFSAAFTALLLTVLSLLVFIPVNFLDAALGMRRVVVCFEAATGKPLWETTAFVAPAERKHSDTTYATPTVAADGTHIIAYFGVGVACLDYQGGIIWKKDDPDYVRNTRYGASSSPLIVGDTAIVVQQAEYGSNRPTWIAAFDLSTGNAVWKIHPQSVREGYSSPAVFQNQLILVGWARMAAFDVRSGLSLWTKALPTQQVIATPLVFGDLLCLAAGTWGPDRTMMMRLDNSNRPGPPELLWESELDTPGDASPVIHNSRLYTVSEKKGKITCFDMLTGEVLWNERIKGTRFSSSPVVGDGKLYVCNTKGLTTVLAADDQFKVIAENDLPGSCFASAAVGYGCIFMRVEDHLYCIGN
ncbi:MAG: PQQ-binding-like beta-propeller repeat protein [Sedimentisphaerales bacterium]|nr:PQQ-binding-like beta-propeller repeat protein [Sedimentisphaerales bacterium]